MIKRKLAAGLAIAAAAIGLAPLQAGAAALTFDQSAADGSVTVSACDFEFGAFVNGSLMDICGAGFGGSATVAPGVTPVTFSGGWADLDVTEPGTRTIFVVTANDPTLISDILTVSWARRAFDPSEASGVNVLAELETSIAGSLGTLPTGVDPLDVFVANGQVVTFEIPYLSGRLVTAVDAPAGGTIPEPSSLALLGLGLAGIALGRRRQG